MKERQERLKEVYEYLRFNGKIHTQSDFAKILGAKRPGISAALNGNPSYLTDNLFRKIYSTFPTTFSLDYLLTGRGSLLLSPSSPVPSVAMPSQPSSPPIPDPYPSTAHESITPAPIPQWADSLIFTVAQQIQKNEALTQELRQSIQEVNTLRQDLLNLIHQLSILQSKNPMKT